MPADRFSGDERGTGPAARQTSSAPHSAAADPGGARVAQATKPVEKGVFFLLSEEGHARYLMQSGVGGQPSPEDHAAGAAVFANSVAFAGNLNRGLRNQYKVTYDPLEFRYFTSLEDMLLAKPSADVAGGTWASAAILTHSTYRVSTGRGGLTKEQGLWVTPDGVFTSALREFALSDDPQFKGFRSRFAPRGSLNIFACGGTGDFTALACAMRAFFGVSGEAYVPRVMIQVREGGLLYAKLDDNRYRRFNPKTDLRTVTVADCGA